MITLCLLFILLFSPHVLYAKTFDVTVYGAMGDGVSDDTLPIQVALNAAAIKGGTVFFPTGVYLLSSGLHLKGSNVNLVGDSATLQIGWYFNTYQPGTVPAILNLVGTATNRLKKITIEGLSFVGMPRLTDQNEPKCISTVYADYVTIQQNFFENFGHECIWPAGSGVAPVHHWRVINNDFFNIGVGGSSPSAVTINGRDFYVAGNTCDTVLGCIGASDQRAVIIGNIIRNPQYFGISSAGDVPGSDDVMIANNQIEVTAGDKGRYGILVISGARNTSVVNNVIRLKTIDGGVGITGIRLQGPHSNDTITSNQIYMDGTGNLQPGNALAGIVGFDNGQGFNIKISDNNIYLVGQNTYYTAGIQMRSTKPTDTLKIVLANNKIEGFLRVNAGYALDLFKSAGSLSYWITDMLADGGYWRFPDAFITDGRYDNVPVNITHVE